MRPPLLQQPTCSFIQNENVWTYSFFLFVCALVLLLSLLVGWTRLLFFFLVQLLPQWAMLLLLMMMTDAERRMNVNCLAFLSLISLFPLFFYYTVLWRTWNSGCDFFVDGTPTPRCMPQRYGHRETKWRSGQNHSATWWPIDVRTLALLNLPHIFSFFPIKTTTKTTTTFLALSENNSRQPQLIAVWHSSVCKS